MKQICRAALVGLILGWARLPAAQAVPDPCQVSDEVTGTASALPMVVPALRPGGVLRVLAVGSATMFGPDASLLPGTVTSQSLIRSPGPISVPTQQTPSLASESAFPRQMAASLQAAVPDLKVDVVVRGGRGLAASEMLDLIRQELEKSQFQLVLWQTGTVEAVRNTPPGEFAQVLSEGVEAIEAAGANLVLIDPQYSRFLQTNSNLDPYTQVLQQTAALPGVELFHRYDVMRSWANDGQIDLERTPKADRRKTVETLHQCLGRLLAKMVLAGVHS